MFKYHCLNPIANVGLDNFTADYEKTDNAVFSFRFYNNIRGIYIDDVTLSLKDGGENIITDSGFEGEIKTEAGTGGGEEPGETPGGEPDVPGGDVEETYDTTPYQPISFMSSGYKKGVLLTWKNPATDTLTDVKVYEIDETTAKRWIASNLAEEVKNEK